MDESNEQGGGEQMDDSQDSRNEQQQRRRDRRMDTASLFGGYNGPERRSGRDRRASA